MPLNKVIFNNNSQNNNTFLKKGTPEGPKQIEENTTIPIVQSEQPQQEIIATASIAVSSIPIGSRPNVLRPNISKNEGSVKYTSPAVNKNKFTSKLLNFIEPYEIGGVRKTAFYSEISTNFKVGQKVFIINGNYDSHDKILNDKYSKGSDGYKVLFIEDCKVVLDIDYTGVNPYQSPLNIDDLIFVHNLDSSTFNYAALGNEPFNYVSTFKSYVTDATIPGELVSLFQGKVVNNVLRTWTGNIVYNRSTQNRNTTDVDFLDNHTGLYATPPNTPRGAFYVRDSLSTPVTGDWIDVTTQIRENKIRLMDIYSNPTNEIGNKRLFILGGDFTWEGTTFQERQIYKFDTTTSKWVVDRDYKIPIITATYFKYGRFLGEHNGGLFGSYLKRNKWNNATWNYGVMINSDWENGFMNTNTKVGDRVVKASLLYDQFSNPYVSQVIDTTNNSGLGFNLTLDCVIKKGIFLQSTFENCDIKGTLGSVVESYYTKVDPIPTITANFSKFKFCDLEQVLLSSSTLVDSVIENSILRRTKAVNSQIFTSLFDAGEFNSDAGIRILGAELNSWDPLLNTFSDNSQIVGVLKLFISDEDFFRMEKNDTFYIERVNKEFFLGSLNTDSRIILPYETKYILNLYWDGEFTTKVGSKQAVSVRDKRSNRNRFYVSKSTSPQTVTFAVPNTALVNGQTWWVDVTARFSQNNRISPAYDPNWTPTQADVNAGTWFFYLYEYDLGGQGLLIDTPQQLITGPLPELPAEPTPIPTFFYQTTHIFRYISVPAFQEPIMSKDGFNPVFTDTYELVFPNADDALDAKSPAQYRGEWTSKIGLNETIDLTPINGLSKYQVNDIVRIYNPQTEKFEYYQCLIDHDPQNVPDSYVDKTFTVGAANTKIIISEQSKYYDYCSIDIETRALGWYKDVQQNKDVYTFDRTSPAPLMPLKPLMDNLLPINLVDKIFRNVTIKNSNFHSGVFVNSNWVSGSLIEDFDLVIQNRDVTLSEKSSSINIQRGCKLVMSRDNTFPSAPNLGILTKTNFLKGSGTWFNPFIRQPKLGDVFHLNSISFQSQNQTVVLDGQYIYGGNELLPPVSGFGFFKFSKPTWGQSPISQISQNVQSPNSAYTTFLTDSASYSVVGAETLNYASLHRVVIENSTIYSGLFKRVYFKNSKLTNRVPYVKPSTFDIDPTSLPKVVNVLFSRNSSTIENAFIFRSHITNITNTGGYFHSCYWNGATFSNGEFQSGYWINGNFLNGRFTDSNSLVWNYIDPSGTIEKMVEFNDDTNTTTDDLFATTINYFDIAKKPIRRIWNDGKFVGGEFYNSYWIDGTFSNGKFWRSRWFAGDWESGIFGDISIKYEETTMGYGWKDPLTTTSTKWFPTIYSLEGFDFNRDYLGRTQSKFFGGVVQNGLVGGNGVVFWYGGQMSSGEFTSASASSNMQSIWYNGTFYGSIFSNYAQWKNGIFNSGKFRSIYGYENQKGIASYRDYLNAPVFAWENGTFNGGDFGMGTPLANSSWKNGNFNGGIFQGRIWYDGVFSGGLFNGSGDPNAIRIKNENSFYIGFRPIVNPSLTLQNLNQYFGLWYRGVVTDKKYQYVSSEKVSSRLKRAESKIQSKPTATLQNLLWLDGLFDHENATIKDSLFVRGTFSNGYFDGGIFNPYVSKFNKLTNKMDEFILTDEPDLSNYKFSNNIDPLKLPIGNGVSEFETAPQQNYIVGYKVLYGGAIWQAKVDVVPGPFIESDWQLLLDSSKINWVKGVFVTGSFYSTTWNNGVFKNGYISGAFWKNGTFEYGTADNIFWDGGVWKNGNWNGAPFNYLVAATGPINPDQLGFSYSVKNGIAKDIILNTDLMMRTYYSNDYKLADSGKSFLFLSNVFSASQITEKIGAYNLRPISLFEGEYSEIWLPYRVTKSGMAEPPTPISWNRFITETTSRGITFWLTQGSGGNQFTQSNNVAGGNYNTGIWSRMVADIINADGEPIPEIGDVKQLASIDWTKLQTLNTPALFVDYINGDGGGDRFTWSGLFEHDAEVYNFRGNPGVKIRFKNYRNNPAWQPFSLPPPIACLNQIPNTQIAPVNGATKSFAYYLDLPKSESDKYGWVTSSFFVTEMAIPNEPKPVNNEFYTAKNFTGRIGEEEIYSLGEKPCSDWEFSEGIPNYWDGSLLNDGSPRVVTKSGTIATNGQRNFVNIASKFSKNEDLPTPPSLTQVQVRANPKGYNTFQKYIESGDPTYQNNPIGGGPNYPANVVPQNSAPSLKIYPRFRTTKLYKGSKFYNRLDCARLITSINAARANTNYLPFNGATGSRVGFYINDKSKPASGCCFVGILSYVTVGGAGPAWGTLANFMSNIATRQLEILFSNATTNFTGSGAANNITSNLVMGITNIPAGTINSTNPQIFINYLKNNVTWPSGITFDGTIFNDGGIDKIRMEFCNMDNTGFKSIQFRTISPGSGEPAYYVYIDSVCQASGCSTLNGSKCYERTFGFEMPVPSTPLTLVNANSATDAEIDALGVYLQGLKGLYNTSGVGDPNAFADFAFFRMPNIDNTQTGLAGTFELYNVYNFPDSFDPFGNLQASLAGPPTTPQEWELRQLYYEGGGGANIYMTSFNNNTKSYDIIQYTTEIEISVELEKEVSFDFFIGTTFSSYTLKSKENIYGNEVNYFPAFYRIKLNYVTSVDNIFTSLSLEEQYLLNSNSIEFNPDREDINRAWIRKTSFGILRIYSFAIRKTKIAYNDDYNNILYASVDQNNRIVSLPATPSVVLSIPSNSNQENSIMFGNGVFRQGIWEKGVWNNGTRVNSSALGFFQGDDILKGNKVIFAVRKTAKDTFWSIKIQLIDNLSAYKLKLDVGGKIAVSNLAAYDNNQRRIFISSVLDVETYSFDENTITVSYKSLTPISYIEKDSEYHLIYLTTNIWTNGAFLNGVFRGVWNNGLFKGSPFLTKMIDSHFIDGTFEGGHFKSVEQKEGLTIYGKHNTGLIQNFKFKDLNNGSPNVLWETNNINQLRNFYQSWIDVVYSTYSMVNLKQDTTQLRVKNYIPLMVGSSLADTNYFEGFGNPLYPGLSPSLSSTIINQPNLKGFPTFDILSSTSEMRDYLSKDKKIYRLGTKRKVFDNLLPDNGNFVKPISSNAVSARQINVNYPGLFPTYPAYQNLAIPFFTTNTSQISYGFTYSVLWRRVGANYVTPGYAGSTPKNWVINQIGHTDLRFDPLATTVTVGDTITFRMNDLRRPSLQWAYSYVQPGFVVRSQYSLYAAYGKNGVTDLNTNSMWPWNDFDGSLSDGDGTINQGRNVVPYQLYHTTNQNNPNLPLNSNPMWLFGWNAYNPTYFGSPWGDPPHPIAEGDVTLYNGRVVSYPTRLSHTNDPVRLGNRIILVDYCDGTTFYARPLWHLRTEQGTLAWAVTDAGYPYPQDRTINTETGMRTTYVANGSVVPDFAQPIRTNQNSNRQRAGLTSSPLSNGLTHGTHYFINANRLIPLYSDILSRGWNYASMSAPSGFQLPSYLGLNSTQRLWYNISAWRGHLNAFGYNDYNRFNITNFNPYYAYGRITVKERPGKPEEGLVNVPIGSFTYQSNTDPNTDNILRLTITDVPNIPSPTAGPLFWVQLFQNKATRPLPNRYYELSVDIVYNLTGTPTYSRPTPDGFYQGLFLDDIFENLEQQTRNAGLPEKNLHQYLNHFYTGKYDPLTRKLTVKSTEYFMNKTNMDLLFWNIYSTRGGPQSIDYRNISLREVDMLPFFCYFSASIFDSDQYYLSDLGRGDGLSPYIPNQIDTSPRFPLQATAPMDESVAKDFSFADNFDLFISSKTINKLNQGVVSLNFLSAQSFLTNSL